MMDCRQVSSLEAPRRAGAGGVARLELERRSLDLERELRPDRDSDASLDERDHLVWCVTAATLHLEHL